LVFKADRVVIPKSMQSEMLERIHEGHQGIEKCKNRARKVMFWPGMNQHIETVIKSCHTCTKYRNKQQREPLLCHEIPQKPWQKVGTDLFRWENRDYVLVADYYSKFIEFLLLPDTKSSTVVTHMKSIFSRHGIPEEVVSDNGPQYSSKEFAKFAEKWEFKHTTSSPRYPQSNGFAERMVQTLKKLLQKAKDSGNDAYLAVLNYRSTPISNTLPSPAEILMNRVLRTRLSIPPKKSKKKKTNKITQELKDKQKRQKHHYDKGTKELPKLQPKDKIYVNDNGEWIPGTVLEAAASPRSYYIQTNT
jgi:transposase InsO family protein